MKSNWLHWKVKSSLWALPLSNGGVYHKIHLVTFLYILLLVDCFKWGLIDHKIHLVTFLYIFLSVDCFKWGLIEHNIHLVTFLYIFLLVDCFKWALIDRIEKWRVHSELCQFQMGGYIIRFTWWHFFISSYWLTVSNELSLTALKSKEFTLCSTSFKCKIHLVTFLYILLWVDCLKWALIDCIEKQRVHSVLCQFQM